MKIKLFILFISILLISNSAIAYLNVDNSLANKEFIKIDNYQHRKESELGFFENNSELIEEYTWSVMRYDHVTQSKNHGFVNMPKPSPGMILVPTNMMCKSVCKAALTVYHENKMETLEALEGYDLDNMVVGLPLLFYRMWSTRNSMPCYGQKSSAQEMKSIAERMFWTDFVGDCYSQSAFNTAVLRLCGFSPEEVFALLMPGHAVTIVKIEDQWYIFDTVQGQFSKKAILDNYGSMPLDEIIYWIENDKYFINFGTPFPDVFPYQDCPYSNIEPNILVDIVEQIVPIFCNSALGGDNWDVQDFIEEAIPCPDIKTIEVPLTVNDAQGLTLEEKSKSLAGLVKDFIIDHTGDDVPNQYDRSLYALGDISVEYPQAYANAAKYATWTSWFSAILDSRFPTLDYLKTILWVRTILRHIQSMEKEYISFADFSYLCQRGCSLEKALMAYGTLRNMKKSNDFWQPEDLYIILTEENKGYLAIDIGDLWLYLNFEKGKLISIKPPGKIQKAFNEIECKFSWDVTIN